MAVDRNALLNENVIVDDLVDEKVNAGIKRHGNIMRVRKPLSYRFINLKTGALILTVGIIVLLLYLFSTG